MKDSQKALPKNLQEAYSRTLYQVQHLSYSIEIDQPNDDLDVFLIDNNTYQYAFVTSVNPKSQSLSPDANAQRLFDLKKLLEVLSLRYCKAIHKDPSGKWEDEASYFILDISPARAKAIGQRFEQYAVVVGGFKRVARLIWIDE